MRIFLTLNYSAVLGHVCGGFVFFVSLLLIGLKAIDEFMEVARYQGGYHSIFGRSMTMTLLLLKIIMFLMMIVVLVVISF